MDVNLI
ncbi:hypothetical protein R3I94_008777 [Phoxinus phoxinus]